MKKKMLMMGLVGMLVAMTAQAQTPPPNFFPTNTPALAQGFLSQLMTWTSSYNTNADHNWTNASIQIDTGVATMTGVGLANRVDIQKNFGSFGVGVAGQFVGVGSTFGEIEGTAAYSIFAKYDLKATVELGGGFDFNTPYTSTTVVSHGKGQPTTQTSKQEHGAIVAEPGLGLYKMMTANSYAGTRYSFPIESHGKFNAAGVIYVCAGVTF